MQSITSWVFLIITEYQPMCVSVSKSQDTWIESMFNHIMHVRWFQDTHLIYNLYACCLSWLIVGFRSSDSASSSTHCLSSVSPRYHGRIQELGRAISTNEPSLLAYRYWAQSVGVSEGIRCLALRGVVLPADLVRRDYSGPSLQTSGLWNSLE